MKELIFYKKLKPLPNPFDSIELFTITVINSNKFVLEIHGTPNGLVIPRFDQRLSVEEFFHRYKKTIDRERQGAINCLLLSCFPAQKNFDEVEIEGIKITNLYSFCEYPLMSFYYEGRTTIVAVETNDDLDLIEKQGGDDPKVALCYKKLSETIKKYLERR